MQQTYLPFLDRERLRHHTQADVIRDPHSLAKFGCSSCHAPVLLSRTDRMPHKREHFITKMVHYNYNPDAQGKLKRITQGMGKIKAVRKYENPMEFPETHKLWMDTNSKPLIRAVDDLATFNRLHPIPFTVTIPKEEIDKSLPRKLLAEAEGILAWAVEGALQWQRIGLDKPSEIAAANDDWKAENDRLGRFIEECCLVSDSFIAKARSLYESYREWAEGAGEMGISETLFGKRLKDRGFVKEHRRQGRVGLEVVAGIIGRIHEPPPFLKHTIP